MQIADDFWVFDWEMIGAVATVLALIIAKRRLAVPFEIAGVVPNKTFWNETLTAKEQAAPALIRDDARRTIERRNILCGETIIGRHVAHQRCGSGAARFFRTARDVRPARRPNCREDRIAMKPNAFADLLAAHASLLRGADAPSGGPAEAIDEIAAGFRAATGASVASVLKRAPSRDDPRPSEPVAQALNALEALLTAAGATAATRDVAALRAAWSSNSLEPTAFAEALRRAPAKKAAPKKPAIDPARLDDLVARLKRAIADPQRFEEVMAEIEADKAIKKAQLQSIAERTLGYPVGALSVAKIKERLRDRPRLEAYQRSKREIIDQINV